MRSQMKRTDQERFKEEANNGCHSCNLSVASALLIALALFHADLAPGAEGAGGSKNFANRNRNVPSSASSSPANKGLGAISAEMKPGIPRPGGADQQPSYKPMLVPDQLDADKDPVLAGRAKPVRLKSTEEFKTEEDAMVKTRSFLKEQHQQQSQREKNLKYLNIHAHLLEEDNFQDKLVNELKKVKDETGHILDYGGNRRGRKKRDAADQEGKTGERTGELDEETETDGGKKSMTGERKQRGKDERETKLIKDESDAFSKGDNGRRGEEKMPRLKREIRDQLREKNQVALDKASESQIGENYEGPKTGGGIVINVASERNDDQAKGKNLRRERRGVPPWKDYLYNLPSNQRGEYHKHAYQKQNENEVTKDDQKHQHHEEQTIALSAKEEEEFQKKLEAMLENLDIETNKFEEEEENKINDLERKKNLYLDHAEKMSKKTRENQITGPNAESAFLEEVTDIIEAAQLQNAITKEKNMISRIIGNSNQPRRPIFKSFKETHHIQPQRQQKIEDATDRIQLTNKFPSNHYYEDVENDLAIYRQPRRKAGPLMEIQKLSGENQNICPDVDNYVRGCSRLMGSREFKIIFYNYCSQHQMCYRCGIASGKGRQDCDNKFVEAVIKVCGIDSPACLSNADYFLQQLQKNVFYFYPFPLEGGEKCDKKCVQKFIEF